MTFRAPHGRIAPSPTGPLHLGHAFAFVWAYLMARREDGSVTLRFEDLDSERAEAKFIDMAQRDLEWLGLEWEGEPVVHSTRIEAFRNGVAALVAQGRAFACTCSRGDLRALGAPQQGEPETRYPGTCRGRYADQESAEREAKRPSALRFQVEEGATRFVDGHYGEQQFHLAESIGDFVIVRKGGIFAYQLTVVIDDALDGVTQVVRGADLLPSTARQLALAGALGYRTPNYFHLPLLCDAVGQRLAKRNWALSLSELREMGITRGQVLRFLLGLSGQDVTDFPERDVAQFSRRLRPDTLPTANIVLPSDVPEALRSA